MFSTYMEIMGIDPADSDSVHWKNISNAAIKETGLDDMDGVHKLHGMWEDNDLDGEQNAKKFAAVIQRESKMPLVFIATGDYIHGDYGAGDDDIYDAMYCLYVVQSDLMEEMYEKLCSADRKWRTAAYNQMSSEVHDSSASNLIYEFQYEQNHTPKRS